MKIDGLYSAALLHIPKTGGSARRHSTLPVPGILWAQHELRLADVPSDVPAIVYVRHPVDRFESGYSVVAPGRLPPIDELAQDTSVIADPGLEIIFRPQSWWLNDDVDGMIIKPKTTENMSWTWPRVVDDFGWHEARPLPEIGEPASNHWARKPNRKRPRLSYQGRLDVMASYQEDMRIWRNAMDREALHPSGRR